MQTAVILSQGYPVHGYLFRLEKIAKENHPYIFWRLMYFSIEYRSRFLILFGTGN